MVIRLINQIRYCTICFTIATCIAIMGLAVLNNKSSMISFVVIPRMQASVNHEMQHALETIMTTNTHISAPTVHEALKPMFPNVAEVTISSTQHPKKQTVVSIVQEKPYLIINNNLVLTEHEHQAPLTAYPIALQENAIRVQSDSITEKDLHDLYEFMSRLPGEILRDYIITWHNTTYIQLYHTTRPYCIKATGKTIFTPSLLKAINAMMDYVENKKDFSKNKTAQWIMDARCKNQIILARQKGEKL